MLAQIMTDGSFHSNTGPGHSTKKPVVNKTIAIATTVIGIGIGFGMLAIALFSVEWILAILVQLVQIARTP